MKTRFIIISVIAFILMSCNINETDKVDESQEESANLESNFIEVKEFLQILDSADVGGSILIYDFQKNTYYSNDFEYAKKGSLPASTFKIANSIIALETSVVEDDSTMFYWNGKKRYLKTWEQDLNFKEAFQFSCVPCYQDIARDIGVERMNQYINDLNYGKMIVDSTNIDKFWLEGDSKINQFQQIEFLLKFYNSELNISERTQQIMKRLLLVSKNENFTISGKTGWSVRKGNNTGWFVGYLNVQQDVYFYAVRVEPNKAFNMKMFSQIRKDVTFKAFKQMGIIK